MLISPSPVKAAAPTPRRRPVRYARWDGVGRPFVVVESTTGEPGPGEVLVEVDLATVCGSDLHTAAGRRGGPAPSVLGHEQVGRVLAVGAGAAPAVTGEQLAPGARVVWSVTVSCGRCDRCHAGLEPKCRRLAKYGHEPLREEWELSGGFATHVLLRPGTSVAVVGEHVPDAVAAPASCATATVAAVLRAPGRSLAGARVLVSGAGMLGLTATAMASSRGATVITVDPSSSRRDQALRFGAAAAVEVHAQAQEVDVAVELSGAPAAVAGCLGRLDVGGTLVLAGSVSPGPSVALDPEAVVRGLQTVVGVHNYRARDLADAVAFLQDHHHRYPFGDLVGAQHRLDEVDKAIEAATVRGAAPRQAIKPAA